MPSEAREPSAGKRAFAGAEACDRTGVVSATRKVAPAGRLAAGTLKLNVEARSPSVDAPAIAFVSSNVAITSPSASDTSSFAVTLSGPAPAIGFA
jgi:hypothetical protein